MYWLDASPSLNISTLAGILSGVTKALSKRNKIHKNSLHYSANFE